MNCQNISRIADRNGFSTLTADELHDFDVHAQSCRHCAPIWVAHARVPAMHVPAMPTELAVRCLTLAAAQTQPPARRATSRRMMVIGSIVALAAAAGMLTMYLLNSSVPQPLASTVAIPQALKEAAPLQPEVLATPEPDPEAEKPSLTPLPLLPAPVQADLQKEIHHNQALRKAFELYPEMTQGPETEDEFVVAMSMRMDGTVMRSALRTKAPTDETDVSNALASEVLPADGGIMTFSGAAKGTRLRDGRVLRGDLSLQYQFAANNYDPTRTKERVEEAVRAAHADLLNSPTIGSMHNLTVLMANDGTIQRENVELLPFNEFVRRAKADNPDDVAGRANAIASKLGIGVDQIGLMGFALLRADKTEANAGPYALHIDYAWSRRPGDSPTYGQGQFRAAHSGIDIAAAQVIVERLIPDAFTQTDRSAGMPTVVLTAEGQVIRVERTRNEERAQRFKDQNFAPGRVMASGTTARLVNSAGESAEVLLFWQYTQAQKDAMKKSREGINILCPAPNSPDPQLETCG